MKVQNKPRTALRPQKSKSSINRSNQVRRLFAVLDNHLAKGPLKKATINKIYQTLNASIWACWCNQHSDMIYLIPSVYRDLENAKLRKSNLYSRVKGCHCIQLKKNIKKLSFRPGIDETEASDGHLEFWKQTHFTVPQKGQLNRVWRVPMMSSSRSSKHYQLSLWHGHIFPPFTQCLCARTRQYIAYKKKRVIFRCTDKQCSKH